MSSPWLTALRDAVGAAQLSTAPGDLFAAGRDLWPKLTLAIRDGRPVETPAAVVRPRDEVQTLSALRVLQDAGVAVVPYGTGSGVCGGAWAGAGTVVLDVKHLAELGPVDPLSLQVSAGPGLVLQDLERRLNDLGYTLGHFPSSIGCASLGGAVAARGAGQLSSRYGKIEDMVTGLRVATPGLGLLATGSLDPELRAPDWTQVFVGSEGTLGVIVSIRLRVHPLPAAMRLGGVRFPSVRAGMAGFRRILQAGLRPSVMRLYDPLDTWMAMTKGNDRTGPRPVPGAGDPMAQGARVRGKENAVEPSRAPPEKTETPRFFGVIVQPGSVLGSVLDGVRAGRKVLQGEENPLLSGLSRLLGADDWKERLKPESLPFDRLLSHPGRLATAIDLLPERCLAVLGCEGEDALAAEHLAAAVTIAKQEGAVDLGPDPGERWFRTRYHVSFKLPKLLRSGAFADTMETAAPWSRLAQLYEGVRRAVRDEVLIMAHLSHAYPEGGSLYFTMVGHGPTPAATEARYLRAWERALAAVHENGGTASHHHGIGVLKRDRNSLEHGDGRRLWEVIKAAVDPKGILNPGKLFPPAPSAPGPVVPKAPASTLRVHPHEDAVVEVGTGWSGAALAAELSGKGLFLQPLGRDFLEEPVAAWVGGQAIPAAHAVHGAWEHPLLAAEGRLPDGRVFRSGLLPRSAAGPNWLPFVAGRASATGTGASTLLLRAGTPPAIRQCGARFPSWEAATAAMREACRRALRPLAGGIYPDLGPSPWRVPLDPASDGAAPVLAVLALPDPDGFPSSARATAQVLAERGGAVISDEEALAWWEDHWAQVAREGEGALSRTGPVASAAEIGRVAAVFPWSRALLCLQAVESLCGGPTRALGWMDGPSEAGVTVRWRFGSSRPKEAIHALVPHQVASTVRAMGGRIVTSRWASTDGSDSFGVSGEAVAKDALGDALVRLLRPVPGSTA